MTVSQDSAGRWFVSLLCDDVVAPERPNGRAVGIDVGLITLCTLSTGEKIENPRHERGERTRLVRAGRELSRKVTGSSNWNKARLKLARVHARISDRGRDMLHKLTTRLVRENQVIVVENLAVRNMLANHTLARAIGDAGWRQLRTMLEYKSAWYGRELVVAARWFPSTRLCSACGATAAKLPLHVRNWTCDCGATHDRDVNAAKNLLAAGLAVTACGADVRPRRDSPRAGGRHGSRKRPG